MANRIKVGVLRGGPSAEYEISLQTGAAVLAAIRSALEDRYEPRDVFIDRSGDWHIDGRKIRPEDSKLYFDVAWNAMHGAYGEDGKVQAILEAHNIPFTGSGSLASALGMNKILAKQVLAMQGIKSPRGKEIASDDVKAGAARAAEELFRSFPVPMVVKPAASGSSVGVSIVKMHQELESALVLAAKHGRSILIEEYIPGREATCAVVEGFRGQELYALPPIEIRPRNAFFDYEAKYAGKSDEIVPSTFSEKTKEELEALAKKVHEALGLVHYSRTDFIVHPRRGIYVLETNTLPGLTEDSLLPKALRAVGSSLPEFIDHVIRLALN